MSMMRNYVESEFVRTLSSFPSYCVDDDEMYVRRIILFSRSLIGEFHSWRRKSEGE